MINLCLDLQGGEGYSFTDMEECDLFVKAHTYEEHAPRSPMAYYYRSKIAVQGKRRAYADFRKYVLRHRKQTSYAFQLDAAIYDKTNAAN